MGDVANAPLKASRAARLLAVDLDGTLLDHQGNPHARDLRALREAKRAGIAISILTGRLYSGTKAAALAASIDGPVGCADGSHIVRVSDSTTLLHLGLIGVGANRLRAAVNETRPATFLFASDRIVHDSAGHDYLTYLTTWSQELEHTDVIDDHDVWDLPSGITAVVCVGTSEQIHAVVHAVNAEARESVQVAAFPIRKLDQWGLVARAAGGTKGTALRWLAEHHGYSVAETVCVGDWLNDVSMFRVAGRSFAMGHAPADVKDVATDVLLETSEAGGGVATAIDRAFGIRVP